MALNFEFFDVAGATVADGVFIPLSDLPGLTAAEIAAAAPTAERESNTILALTNTIYTRIQSQSISPLGLNLTKAAPVGAGADLINQNYGMVITYWADHSEGSLKPLPVPTTGTNANKGEVSFANLFPNLAFLDGGDATPSPGVLLPAPLMESYGSPSYAALSTTGINGDARLFIASLWNLLFTDSTLRATNTASAIINRTRGNAAGFAPPAAYTAMPNPTTGLMQENLMSSSFFNVPYGITIQLKLEATTLNVNVAS